jgi:cation transport ATPase
VRGSLSLTRVWLGLCILGVAVGGLLVWGDQHAAGHAVWAATTVVGGLPVVIDVVRSIARRQAGVDLIAVIAIAGCLALHEYAAGAVVALMLASGRALEEYADRRAHRELSSLLARAPHQVHRYEDGALQTRAVDEVALGDRLFVKTGEVVPVDGMLQGDAVLDESALSG